MAKAPIYSLDTNVFMDWQARFYPVDVFRSLDQRIEKLIALEGCLAVALVREEIDSVGTPELRAWAKKHSRLFVPMSTEVQKAGAAIEARYPDLLDPKSPYQSADAYVIALAQIESGIVVSQETSASEKRNPAKNHYIPDVCRELGLHCVNLLGLMRRERWVL
jgi:hypothetical protein